MFFFCSFFEGLDVYKHKAGEKLHSAIMWWKLFLLTLYLVALFLLSRILETVAYYEGGYLASRILDPVSLSVKKLKLLLDQRGVSYAGVVEKQELTELIENSGKYFVIKIEIFYLKKLFCALKVLDLYI